MRIPIILFLATTFISSQTFAVGLGKKDDAESVGIQSSKSRKAGISDTQGYTTKSSSSNKAEGAATGTSETDSNKSLTQQLQEFPPLSQVIRFVETDLKYKAVMRAEFRPSQGEWIVYAFDATEGTYRLRLDPITFEVLDKKRIRKLY